MRTLLQIRLKRLAKLQSAPSTSSGASTPTASTSTVQSPQPKPKPAPRTVPTPISKPATPNPIVPATSPSAKKRVVAKLDFASWEHDAIGHIFKVTLDVSAHYAVEVAFLHDWYRVLLLSRVPTTSYG